MCHVVVIGAGITGVTTAYELSQLGYQVTVVDRHLFPAMETSFANGGQLSACNAEVWNQKSTVLKGMKWMSQKSAPLLLNPAFSVHKYAWLMEFLGNIKHYEANTHETVRLALLARQRLFEIADKESIDFNLEKRGILHFYHNKQDYDVAIRVNDLLNKGGLERCGVSNEEIKQIEPTLTGDYYAGFYCEGDATGDIHKYTTGLAEVTKKLGVKYRFGMDVTDIEHLTSGVEVKLQPSSENVELAPAEVEMLAADAVVVCAGVGSYQLAELVQERVNVYPVKGYSITVMLNDEESQQNAPWVSLLDESAKIVTSRLGKDRFRVAGTAEFNGYNRDIRADRIQPLVDWTNRNFKVSTEHAVPWAGLRPMMPNMMPVVRRGKLERVFFNTGHGHLGWTLSAATAAMISQEVATAYPV
ncbi:MULTISPECIES: D-amino acid dehydrogenase [Acinetobacter]|uniref:D-amino acid dehydrogenase n=2 Tax=Acinetobacter TaxID=469 RepID=A0A239RXB7_ACIJO|nr:MULTISPECIES: D-amino acid dehydrogenase [Acinetobacter]NWK62720.1 D-amino acid dehydrogenase [Acinetobacter sp. SwsAc3]MBO7704392.1 D-amino acid dehydrogenase [Acinetobacter sp.]MCV2451575.1 D-amino acid dehydrogenase [Acinetobacter johnsonii]MDG9787884.1 D-amino acid dehydrogenase [Acinetobacter johnsonii]MDG9798909.1 D-amino acid dehydrogenase [Acinetobacter johnsonii]